MSDNDPYAGWRWDREDKAANRQALVMQKHGHLIRFEHKGLLIDGQRLASTAWYVPVPGEADQASTPPYELCDDGRFFYRGHLVARFAPPVSGTAGPGPLELFTGTQGGTVPN